MNKRENFSAKIIGIMIIIGLPAIGLLLMNVADTMGDMTYYYIGVILVFLFPILIAGNLVLQKGK
jgi:hypothetical protein